MLLDVGERRQVVVSQELRSAGANVRCTLEDAGIPERFQDMFASLPESDFRYDLSSTELRMADGYTTNSR